MKKKTLTADNQPLVISVLRYQESAVAAGTWLVNK